jgi:hypothetical protein
MMSASSTSDICSFNFVCCGNSNDMRFCERNKHVVHKCASSQLLQLFIVTYVLSTMPHKCMVFNESIYLLININYTLRYYKIILQGVFLSCL